MATITEVHRSFPFPAAQVFDYVSDMLNYGKWFPGVLKLWAGNDLPHNAIGKRYVEQLEWLNGSVEMTLEVVHCDAPRRFVTEGDLPGFLPRMSIELTPKIGVGSQLSLRYETRDPELSANPEMLEQISAELTPRATAALASLQRLLE